MDGPLYMISEAARRLEVEAHVLRFWEEELHISITRNEQGYRCYTDQQLSLFRRIKTLRASGYQLRAIKLILPRLDILDEEEFRFMTSLSEEMNRRAADNAESETLPSEMAEDLRSRRIEEFQMVISEIIQLSLDACSSRLADSITDRVSTKIIKEMDYLLRTKEEKELPYPRQQRRSALEAAASHLPFHRKRQ